ncbi:MAG: glycoside hydrolase family 3 N-terminal domain-containing protein [Thermoleophilia bacterium]
MIGPLGAAVAIAAAMAGGPAAPSAAAPPPADLSGLTAAQLAGQRLVYGFSGTRPPVDLVRRIRRGEAGAVILLGGNVPSVAAARALVRRLQAIPRPAAVDRPLLVMVDQEGGLVRRIPGPPLRRASAMGAAGVTSTRAAGRAAGRLLRTVGANVDLAPVADVARPGSFLEATGRTFGRSPGRVAGAAVAFSRGLRDAGVAAAAKHFPGLGSARVSTDEAPGTVALARPVLERVDLHPFRALIRDRVPMVMVSTARYPAVDRVAPAALSRSVVTGLLRERLGFTGVTVTDALDTPALRPAGGTGAVAVRAAGAGEDLLIHTGYAPGVTAARALTAAITSGRLPRAEAERAVGRVLALRSALPAQ